MKKYTTLPLPLFLLFNHALAQVVPTCPPGQKPAETCKTACVYCDINGYTGSTVGYKKDNLQPVDCCIYFDNDQWLGFVAGDTMADFTVIASGCVNNNGLQIALYENCNSYALECSCGGQGAQGLPLKLNDVKLNPGSTYYLVIDGWSNDLCSFVINVDPPSAVIANPIGTSIGPLQGPAIICPGATVTFSVPPVSNAGTYTWTVPAGWKINGLNPPQNLPAADGGNTVKIKVGPNSGQICVKAANSCFPDGPSVCRDILVGPAPVNVLPPAYVCHEDAPYKLPWGDQAATSGTYEKTLKSSFNCDSVVRQEVVIRPAITTTLPGMTICTGDTFAVCGYAYTGAGNYSRLCQSYLGCDSLVDFSLSVLAPQAKINGSSTLTCANPAIALQAAASPPGTLFQWKNGLGQPLSDGTQFSVTTPGMYILTATLQGGVTTCVQADTVVISENTSAPNLSATGGTLNCTVKTATLNAGTDISTPAWAWSGPGLFSASIANPATSLAGAYSVTVTDPSNGCTSSLTTTVKSDTVGPVVSATGATLSCAVTSAQLGINATPVSIIYHWTGPNGFMSDGPSPVVTEPGIYTVTVIDTTNHCPAFDTTEVLLDAAVPGAIAGAGGAIGCPTPEIPLSGISPAAGALYAWTGPNGFSASQPNPLASLAGVYTLLVTGPNGCTSTATVAVSGDTVPPDASASGGTLNCAVPAIVLQGGSATTGVSFSWAGPNGFLAIQQNPLAADTGVYTLTVSGLNHCTATATAFVEGDFDLPELHTASDTITCLSPAVYLTAGSLTDGTNFQWTGPGGFNSPLDTALTQVSGQYTLTATAPNGCTVQTSVFVPMDISGPGADAQGDTLTCSTPFLNLAGSSGLPHVQWHWNGPDNFVSTEQNPGIVLPGLYQLEVTNLKNGCTSVDDVLVEADQVAPVAGASGGTLTCSLDSLTLTGTSDMGSVFTWSGPGGLVFQGPSPVVTLPGDYTLIALALHNGCADTTSVTVLQDITPPEAGAQGGTLDCSNLQIMLSGSSGTPGAVFSWTGPGNFSTSEQNPTVSTPGQYVLTVTGPNGCPAGATAEVPEDIDLPVVTLDGAGTLTCAVTSLLLESAIETPGASGVWTGPGNFMADTSAIVVSVPGVYTYTVIAPNGCKIAPALTVLQDTLPPQSITTQGGLLNCSIQSLVITAGSNPPADYNWSGPGNFFSTLQSPAVAQPGQYIVTVTGLTNGCSATATATVTQDLSAPDITVQSDSLTCTNPELTLNATTNTPTSLFAWSGPGNFTSAAEDPPVVLAGVYIVTVTGPNGCTTVGQHTVHQNIAQPVISAAGDTLNCAEPSGQITSQTLTPGAVYAWSGPGSFASSTASAAVSVPGLYQVVVTTPNGCSASAQVNVAADTLPPVLTVHGGILTCLDSTVALFAVSDVAVSWHWTGPAGFSAHIPDPDVVVPGNYLLEATATNGCMATGIAKVEDHTQAPALDVLPPDSLDCNTTQVTLEALVKAGGTFGFQWNTADGIILAGANTPTIQAGQIGQYMVLVTDLFTGCSAMAATTVWRAQDLPSGVELIRHNISCYGKIDGALEIVSIAGGTPPFSYAVDDLNFEPTTYFPGLTAGTHTLTVQDFNNCVFATTFGIGEPAELLLELGPDTIIQLGQVIELRLEGAVNYPERIAETRVTPADLVLPILLTPLHTFQYRVTVVDSSGCEAGDSRLVVVRKERRVYIPNTFQPNAPGNDLLYVFGGDDVQIVKIFAIYDRWGNQIFEKKDFLPNDPAAGWDGSYRGAALTSGVFVYYAEVLFIDGETRLYKGDVTLMR